jgi:hypothetical protein
LCTRAGLGDGRVALISIKCARTTLDIDDDVLQAARERTARVGKSMEQVLSELARRGLTSTAKESRSSARKSVHGFRPFAPRVGVVTNEIIDKLRDDDVY